MTVKAGENKITKIDFTMFKANIITKYNSTSVDTKATSFTVDCNGASEFELLFNVANNGAITNMVITYETEDDVPAEDTVAPITFTANTTPIDAENNTYEKGTILTFSTATEGATMSYTINDRDAIVVEASSFEYTLTENADIYIEATKEGFTSAQYAASFKVYESEEPTPGLNKTVTFDFKMNDYGLERNASSFVTDGTTITSGDISIELTKTTGNGWRLWDDGLRAYKGNGPVMTVKAGENKITKIDFTMQKTNIITKYNDTNVTEQNFTVNCNGASEFKLTFNVANNGAINQMVITLEDGGDVPADAVAPITFTASTDPIDAENNIYEKGTILTFATATEGVTMSYIINDDFVEVEGNSFEYTLTKDAEVYIEAKKEGFKSAEYTASFKVYEREDPTPELSYGTTTFDFINEDYGLTRQTSGTTYIAKNTTFSNGYVTCKVIDGDQRLWSTKGYRFQKGVQEFEITVPAASIITEVKISGTNALTTTYYKDKVVLSAKELTSTADMSKLEVTYREAKDAYSVVADANGISFEGEGVYYYEGDNAPAWNSSAWKAAQNVTLAETTGSYTVWVKQVTETTASWTSLAHTYYVPGDDEPAATFSAHDSETLTPGHWYMLVAQHNGRTMSLSTETADGHHVAVPLAVENGSIMGYANHFNKLNIAELCCTEDGHFVFKNDDGDASENYLAAPAEAAKVAGMSRAQSATAPSETTVSLNADGTHNILIDGLKLGYDPASETFGFSAAHTDNVQLYTTGANKVNTGVDNVAADDKDAKVEYYNLQGIRIDNPSRGLYIRRQGNTATKVVL